MRHSGVPFRDKPHIFLKGDEWHLWHALDGHCSTKLRNSRAKWFVKYRNGPTRCTCQEPWQPYSNAHSIDCPADLI